MNRLGLIVEKRVEDGEALRQPTFERRIGSTTKGIYIGRT